MLLIFSLLHCFYRSHSFRFYVRGRREMIRAPLRELSEPPSKGWPSIYLYTSSEIPTLSYRVIWACSERLNLYSRQLIVLPRKKKPENSPAR